MIWKNRTRIDATLRKLIHADSTEENIHIEDILSNISQSGTPVNADNLNVQEKNIGTYGNDTYSSLATYNVGDIVTYEGLLYRCIVAIATAEDFNIDHWESISVKQMAVENSNRIENVNDTLQGEIDDINDDINDLNTKIDTDITSVISRTNTLLGTEEYDEESTYEVGDFCIHENVIYVCITKITEAEAWDSSKWNQTSIIDLPSKSFIDEVTFNESAVLSNCEFVVKGNMVFIRYQGESTTHTGGESSGTVLFTVPSQYAPKNGTCFSPFIQNSNTYGIVRIGGNGICRVNAISSTSNSGRVYFNTFYTI